jgi:hypothetical protein
VDNLRSILSVMCVMWITQKKPESMSDLSQLSCGVTHIRHAVLGLDFWGIV